MELLVKEGDHVRKGQVVARIEHIQAAGRCASAESRGCFCRSRFAAAEAA